VWQRAAARACAPAYPPVDLLVTVTRGAFEPWDHHIAVDVLQGDNLNVTFKLETDDDAGSGIKFSNLYELAVYRQHDSIAAYLRDHVLPSGSTDDAEEAGEDRPQEMSLGEVNGREDGTHFLVRGV
jgi:hypothetical protein